MPLGNRKSSLHREQGFDQQDVENKERRLSLDETIPFVLELQLKLTNCVKSRKTIVLNTLL